MTEDEQPAQDETLTPQLRELIAELDAWLRGMPEESFVEHVLAFATEWILNDVEGLDVERYTDEVKRFVLATPMPDRVLLRFKKDVEFWLAGLMILDAQYEPAHERAREVLAAAKDEIASRAGLLEQEGFRNVAAGFRRLLDESAGGEPPADVVWSALALRIAEPFLEDPVNVIPLVTPSLPPSEQHEPSPE